MPTSPDKKISPSLEHFEALMGPYGFYQHATGMLPNLAEGYCTDDNTRAVSLLLRWQKAWPHTIKTISPFLDSCWQFVRDAQRPDNSFYNFRSSEGKWLEHDISEDMYARIATMLVDIITLDSNIFRKEQAQEILTSILPIMRSFQWHRALSESIISLSKLPEHKPAQEIIALHIDRLYKHWQMNSTENWPWFEKELTYANALLPHAALAASNIDTSHDWNDALKKSGDFLIQSTIKKDTFYPIGNKGWFKHTDAVPASEDHQPIEATSSLDFFLAYNQAKPTELPIDTIIAPYLWFYGKNAWHIPVAQPSIGASHDGLSSKGVNLNCGAESTLAYLMCEVNIAQSSESIRSVAYEAGNQLLGA